MTTLPALILVMVMLVLHVLVSVGVGAVLTAVTVRPQAGRTTDAVSRHARACLAFTCTTAVLLAVLAATLVAILDVQQVFGVPVSAVYGFLLVGTLLSTGVALGVSEDVAVSVMRRRTIGARRRDRHGEVM